MSKFVVCVFLLSLSSAFGQFGFHFPDDSPHPRRGLQEIGRGAISFIPDSISRATSAFRDRLMSTETSSSTTTTTEASTTTEKQIPVVESRQSAWQFNPDESCVTIDGGVGACISIRSCQPYLEILQDVRNNPNAVNVLRRSHCGFDGNDPKVCCPKTLPIPTAPPQPATPEPPPPVPDNSNVNMPDSGSNGGDSASNGADSPFVAALPDPPECGFSNASFSRVVGGIPAKLGDFPWMALLGYKSQRFPGQARWLCGGSLVTAKHVLTAAHCIHGHEDDLYQVRLGELDVSRDDDGATPLDVPISRKTKHEEYNAKAFTNDIGVLLLAWSVKFTFLIRPICLPRTAELRALNFERYTPLIAGWGDTEFRGPSAPHLQVLQLPVVTNAFCANAYRAYKQQVIDERVLCAGYEKGGRDACQGDSGGPLMQPIYNTQTYRTFFYQIGVVSYGRKCAEAGFPGVYSRTTHFMPWLSAQLVGTPDL